MVYNRSDRIGGLDVGGREGGLVGLEEKGEIECRGCSTAGGLRD